MEIASPYLLFLGHAPDALAAKVAFGIRDWRPEKAIGQLRLKNCQVDLGLPDLTVEEAVGRGARTTVVGVANRGGVIAPEWIPTLHSALAAGMDLAAGLHQRLAEIPDLADAAAAGDRTITDVRHPRGPFVVGTGERRPGRRVLTVGTDCSCGKMYASLAIEKELRARGIEATFRATGQSGILITGGGVPVDAVVADFISGAVEALAPAAGADHWDVIEGQGSLFHPSYAGVTLGLLHGAQPDALVLCHEPTRTHMRGLPGYPVPDLAVCMERFLAAARLTSPEVRFAGIAVNTSGLDEEGAQAFLARTESEHGLPAVDPIRTGVGRICEELV